MPSGRAAICPTCGRAFTEGELFCPFDRTALPPAAVSPQGDPLINTVVNGSYTVLERLGSGGMGVVYKALQHRLNRHVALKVLSTGVSNDPAAADRFRVEALAASQLTNGHTVIVHDFGAMDDGCLYIAMQLLEGEPLRLRLKRGPLPPRTAATITMHVCESLAEAHGLVTPIIHRDIKPDNVFIRDVSHGNVHATVLDFGLARFADSQRLRLTSANVVLGTPAYMSPEQCRAQPLDPRSDLYSVGILLFEMLTGRPPFESPDPTSLLFKHVYDAPPRPGEIKPDIDLPAPLEELLLQLLAKAPADRPRSAGEVAHRLEEIVQTLPRLLPVAPVSSEALTIDTPPVFGPPPGAPSDPRTALPTLGVEISTATPPTPEGNVLTVTPRPLPRRPSAVIGAVLGLVAIAIGVAFFIGRSRPAPAAPPAVLEEAHVTAPPAPPPVTAPPPPPPVVAQPAPAPVTAPAPAVHAPPPTRPKAAATRTHAAKSPPKKPAANPWDVD